MEPIIGARSQNVVYLKHINDLQAMIVRRIAYKDLMSWKKKANRKPLILRGARQVGKTTLLKTFANHEYKDHIYLNFENNPSFSSLFLENLDPNRIIEALSLIVGKPIESQHTLIIFDEIQECPEALNSLKYFYEDAPEYDVCAAGSLLGVKLANKKGFPVGKVEFIDLYPMSFSEYLNATGESELNKYLLNIKSIAPIPEVIHVKLIDLFKRYLFVSGMPEVVSNYAKNNDLLTLRKKQKDILDAYNIDFAKHAPKSDVMRISEIWSSIPSQLAKENKRFLYSKIKQSARSREYENAIQWLVDAGLINKTYNISTPKLPLKGYTDLHAFKLYMMDAGLLGAMADVSPQIIINGNELFSHFNGSFIENYVAQALTATDNNLYYWTSRGKAELDFLLQYENRILPIKVKSGNSKHKKSLGVYKNKYSPPLALVISPSNLKIDGNIMNCPLYMVDYLTKGLLELSL